MATDTLITMCKTLSPIVLGPHGSILEEAGPPEEADFLRGWGPSSRPTRKDEAESERVGRKIGAVSRQCWFNARRAILRLDDYADASYSGAHPFGARFEDLLLRR
jgi:hypothetical protein